MTVILHQEKSYCYKREFRINWHASSFEEGLLAIVNEGGDADTNGAIACAILGAKFGYSSIPKYYIQNLNNRAMYHRKIASFINKVIDEKT